jgi:aryl-alcohol dehydrogenase-like predicted oxidoreductase
MLTRTLGKSGIEVSAMGLGCWAIGGPLWYPEGTNRLPLCWGKVDDDESIWAIHRALDLGVNFFDTADSYGAGHSERVLGRALVGKRHQVIVATKFGEVFDEETRDWLGYPHPDGVITPAFIRQSCEASLRRLDTDYVDLYQFHWKDYDPNLAADLLPVLEDLVAEGKIRWYGWSTPHTERARVFAAGEHCVAIQYNYNIFERNPEMLALCEEYNLVSIARGPLAMGLLTGKFRPDSQIPQDDIRSLLWDLQGEEARQLDMLQAIHEILTQDGRTLPQAALGWLWARGLQIIPITGFKTVKQVEENAGALAFGPLSDEQMQEIDRVLGEYVDLKALNVLD